MSRVEAGFQAAGLATEGRVVRRDPREAVVHATREGHVDRVVIGSHGRSGLARLLLGSVAHHVVSHAPCHVLLVKRPEGAAA